MYKHLRNLFYLSFIAILIAAFVRLNFLRSAEASATTQIQDIAAVDRGDIALTVSATGAIHAQQEVPLAFASVGKVTEINVAEGDRVLKGQTLAVLDTESQQILLQNTQLALNLQRAAYNALTAA